MKESHNRQHKLNNNHTTIRIFLIFPATTRNIEYEDTTSGKIKTARHIIYDRAHNSTNDRPPYAQQLTDIVDTAQPCISNHYLFLQLLHHVTSHLHKTN